VFAAANIRSPVGGSQLTPTQSRIDWKGSAGAIDPGPDGAGRAICPSPCTVVSGFPSGTAKLSRRQARRSALGLTGQLLDKMTACRPPKQDPELKRDDYCELHEQIGDDALTL